MNRSCYWHDPLQCEPHVLATIRIVDELTPSIRAAVETAEKLEASVLSCSDATGEP